MTGLELGFALMGVTVGLWVGVRTEATRTREVRRVFRQRLRTSRVESPRRPEPVPSVVEPMTLGDEGGRGADAASDSVSFGLVG